MRHLRLWLAVTALAGCVTEPVEQPPFFEAAVFQLQEGAPLMTFRGEDWGWGWTFAPDPEGSPELEIPDGVSSGFNIHTGAPGSDGSGFVVAKLRTYGIPVPPRPATYDVARLDDPLDPGHYGTMHGSFIVADYNPMRPGQDNGETVYDIVEGSVIVHEISPDAPAAGTIFVTGEARQHNGRPPVLRLEGTRIRVGQDWDAPDVALGCGPPVRHTATTPRRTDPGGEAFRSLPAEES